MCALSKFLFINFRKKFYKENNHLLNCLLGEGPKKSRSIFTLTHQLLSAHHLQRVNSFCPLGFLQDKSNEAILLFIHPTNS